MSVPRRSLKDLVKQRIQARILRGYYSPGTPLREVALAKEFNTSPIPVREALRELESNRIVESEPFKGVRVRAVTPEDMRQAYQLRAVLESSAAESAAKVFKGKAKALRRQVQALISASAKGDIEDYVQEDLPFHRMIVGAAGNAFLLRAWEALGFEIRARMYLVSRRYNLKDLALTHVPIVDALEKGNGPLAARLLREHCLRFAADLQEVHSGGYPILDGKKAKPAKTSKRSPLAASSRRSRA